MENDKREERVVVAAYTYITEAETGRVLLEENGIPSEIKDEYVVSSHAFLSNAVGGIKVLVSKENEDMARKILKEEDTKCSNEYKHRCFNCESTDVTETKLNARIILLGILTLGLYFPFLFKPFRCNQCGNKW